MELHQKSGVLPSEKLAKLSRMVNAKAKTTVAQLCARVQRTHQECPNLPAMETEVPRNGVQGVKTKEITEKVKQSNSNYEEVCIHVSSLPDIYGVYGKRQYCNGTATMPN